MMPDNDITPSSYSGLTRVSKRMDSRVKHGNDKRGSDNDRWWFGFRNVIFFLIEF